MTRRSRPIAAADADVRQLLGDGTNGRTDIRSRRRDDHEASRCPPAAGERALYKRAISRTYAEWPLVEICARAVVSDGMFQFVRIAAGGIAPVPLRLAGSEAALQGKPANAATIAEAAQLAATGAKPLPMTAYKLDLLAGLVRDLMERLAA